MPLSLGPPVPLIRAWCRVSHVLRDGRPDLYVVCNFHALSAPEGVEGLLFFVTRDTELACCSAFVRFPIGFSALLLPCCLVVRRGGTLCDWQVRVWNASTGRCLHSVTLEAAIISLSFHPSGRMLAIASSLYVYLWDYNVSD